MDGCPWTASPAPSAGRLEPTLVADLVALAAARDGGSGRARGGPGRRLTWADLDREVARVATGWATSGWWRASGCCSRWATASSS